MASAVLASRNEAHWGERKVYMRNYPKNPNPVNHSNNNNHPHFNPNPRLNPNPNFNHGRQQIHEHTTKPIFRPNNEPSPRVPLPSTAEFNRKPIASIHHKDAFHREYVTFDLALYSKTELRELKTRLVSELDRVRGLLTRIETREVESRPSSQAPPHHACDSVITQPEPPLQKAEQHHVGSGFATGKAKNKINKVSGQKRPPNADVVPSGRDVKRPAMEDVAACPEGKVMVAMMKKCKQILTKLMKPKASWWFNTPVDVNAFKLFDYYQVIKHPMDLGTVKSKLEKNGYETPQAFAADVRLTYNNAMTYNPKGHDVHVTAGKFLSMFEQMFGPPFKKFESEYARVVANVEQMNVNQKSFSKQKLESMPSDLPPVKNYAEELNGPPASLNTIGEEVQGVTPKPIPRLGKLPNPKASALLNSSGGELHGVAPMPMPMPRMGKLAKPKARDLNKRSMTYEEKKMLGKSLEELPEEKGEHMLHIIRKRSLDVMQDGNEIELDIEALDNETLWELDRFVTSYQKKAANKMMRQELIENVGSAGMVDMVNQSPVHEVILDGAADKNINGDVVDEDVDIGVESPVGNFPPVEIEKDAAGVSSRSSSSSSSSSSSGSSTSSGSDSGNSSGSDSGEDSVQSPFIESKEAAGVVAGIE